MTSQVAAASASAPLANGIGMSSGGDVATMNGINGKAAGNHLSPNFNHSIEKSDTEVVKRAHSGTPDGTEGDKGTKALNGGAATNGGAGASVLPASSASVPSQLTAALARMDIDGADTKPASPPTEDALPPSAEDTVDEASSSSSALKDSQNRQQKHVSSKLAVPVPTVPGPRGAQDISDVFINDPVALRQSIGVAHSTPPSVSDQLRVYHKKRGNQKAGALARQSGNTSRNSPARDLDAPAENAKSPTTTPTSAHAATTAPAPASNRYSAPAPTAATAAVVNTAFPQQQLLQRQLPPLSKLDHDASNARVSAPQSNRSQRSVGQTTALHAAAMHASSHRKAPPSSTHSQHSQRSIHSPHTPHSHAHTPRAAGAGAGGIMQQQQRHPPPNIALPQPQQHQPPLPGTHGRPPHQAGMNGAPMPQNMNAAPNAPPNAYVGAHTPQFYQGVAPQPPPGAVGGMPMSAAGGAAMGMPPPQAMPAPVPPLQQQQQYTPQRRVPPGSVHGQQNGMSPAIANVFQQAAMPPQQNGVVQNTPTRMQPSPVRGMMPQNQHTPAAMPAPARGFPVPMTMPYPLGFVPPQGVANAPVFVPQMQIPMPMQPPQQPVVSMANASTAVPMTPTRGRATSSTLRRSVTGTPSQSPNGAQMPVVPQYPINPAMMAQYPVYMNAAYSQAMLQQANQQALQQQVIQQQVSQAQQQAIMRAQHAANVQSSSAQNPGTPRSSTVTTAPTQPVAAPSQGVAFPYGSLPSYPGFVQMPQQMMSPQAIAAAYQMYQPLMQQHQQQQQQQQQHAQMAAAAAAASAMSQQQQQLALQSMPATAHQSQAPPPPQQQQQQPQLQQQHFAMSSPNSHHMMPQQQQPQMVLMTQQQQQPQMVAGMPQQFFSPPPSNNAR